MKKVLVLKTLSEEEKENYLSVKGCSFFFNAAQEASLKDMQSADIIIGDVSPEILKLIVRDEEKEEKETVAPAKPDFSRTFKKPVVLASGSPRRSELLRRMDIPFVVMPADIDETFQTEDPALAAEEVSAKKAEEVAKRLLNQGNDPFVVLSADTVVSIDGKILGKPRDEEDAFNVLKELQGREHDVYTGVTIGIRPDGDRVYYKHFHEKTRVKIYPVTDDQIREYISTGEPLDKAGSYAIQGGFAKYIKSIQGDYSNVVGLPVGRVFKELRQFMRKF